MLSCVADAIDACRPGHAARVAVDGPPAAGKTTLADELAAVLRSRGRSVIRATIEDFLFPEAHRYRRGRYSPMGCYHDNHDYPALTRLLLDPLAAETPAEIQLAVYARQLDRAVTGPTLTVDVDAVLVFDGVFLMRPELRDRWDLSVFVSTSFETTVKRAQVRERYVSSRHDVERRWRERYLPSQQHYLATARPLERADVVVHNDDLYQPRWEFPTGPCGFEEEALPEEEPRPISRRRL
jgi:uridine kinase